MDAFFLSPAANDDDLGRLGGAHASDCLRVVLHTLREIDALDHALGLHPRRNAGAAEGAGEERATVLAELRSRAYLRARRQRALTRLRWLVDLVGCADAWRDEWPGRVQRRLPAATPRAYRVGVVYDMNRIGAAPDVLPLGG